MRLFLLALGSPDIEITGSRCLESPYHAHPDCTLGDNLANRWRKRGHEVCNWPDKAYEGVDVAEYFDGVFLYHLMHAKKWESMAPNWAYGKKPSVCWLHHAGANPEARLVLDRFDYLPALHRVIQDDVTKLSPKGHVFVLPWPSFSSWEWPPSQPNPYSGNKPVVLFCGTLRQHLVEMLAALQAELSECEIHVIACNIYDRTTRGELKGNADGLFMLDELPKGCVYHPPMAHGSFGHFYWYADVALDIPAHGGQRVANTKLMDYLAAGLPIVASGFAPGMEIAQQLGRIKIADLGNVQQAAQLARETIAAGRQDNLRQLSRDYIREHCSSNSVADTLAELFENHEHSAAA